MADEPENLVLRYLRNIDAKVDALAVDMREVKARLGSVEKQVAGRRVDFADLRADLVRVEHRIDRADERLARIERRLDLHDPAVPG
jgi:septal ring factor EnvC (AmiA/AmiB activator)